MHTKKPHSKRKLLKELIDLEKLREKLSYDPETGWLIWRGTNKRAGYSSWNGYRGVKIFQIQVKEHRLIWYWVTGEEPPEIVDHKNRIRNDNRWGNLREATQSQNLFNSEFSGETRGIRKHLTCYTVTISIDGVNTAFNGIPTLDEAIALRRKLENEHYGEFAPGDSHRPSWHG